MISRSIVAGSLQGENDARTPTWSMSKKSTRHSTVACTGEVPLQVQKLGRTCSSSPHTVLAGAGL
jgi:hypothetical protein